MSAYNCERYVRDAVSSVLHQTFSDLELIVVNDGSTDATGQILDELCRSDDRLRVIERPNSGRPSIARNDGISAARGSYLSFLDCDDLYDPARTEFLLSGLLAHPDWVAAFHDLRLIESDGREIPGTYLHDADFLRRAAGDLQSLGDGWYESLSSFYVFQSLYYAALHTQSVMIAVDRVARDALKFDTGLVICEDTDLWIRLGMAGKIGYLDRVLSSYRQHASSLTGDLEKKNSEMVKMHSRNYARIRDRLSGDSVRLYREKLARLAADLGYARFRRGDLAGARGAYTVSLEWHWSAASLRGFAKACLPARVAEWMRRASQ
jgi:glycosyltransferase involved in cell wall biosynthesis